MCIIYVAQQVHPKYPLIIASNRNEFLDRTTQHMEIWTADSFITRATDGNNGNSDSAEEHQKPAKKDN